MFDPITAFHERIGEPIGHWLWVSGGAEVIGIAIGSVLMLGVAVTVTASVVDAIFGLGWFDWSGGHCDPRTGDCPD